MERKLVSHKMHLVQVNMWRLLVVLPEALPLRQHRLSQAIPLVSLLVVDSASEIYNLEIIQVVE